MDTVLTVLVVLACLVIAGLVGVGVLHVIQQVTVEQRRRRQRFAQSQLEMQLQRMTQDALRQMLLQARMEQGFTAQMRRNMASSPLSGDVIEGDVVDSHE